METFRKVNTSERKPQTDTVVIGFWDEDETAARAVVRRETGYWNEAHEGYECDEPDWWLEKIES